jgi:hypothetical protein
MESDPALPPSPDRREPGLLRRWQKNACGAPRLPELPQVPGQTPFPSELAERRLGLFASSLPDVGLATQKRHPVRISTVDIPLEQ